MGYRWRNIYQDRSDRVERCDVLPRWDLKRHTLGRCWCRPSVERIELMDGRIRFLVGHKSADGRELVEEHGVN